MAPQKHELVKELIREFNNGVVYFKHLHHNTLALAKAYGT